MGVFFKGDLGKKPKTLLSKMERLAERRVDTRYNTKCKMRLYLSIFLTDVCRVSTIQYNTENVTLMFLVPTMWHTIVNTSD